MTRFDEMVMRFLGMTFDMGLAKAKAHVGQFMGDQAGADDISYRANGIWSRCMNCPFFSVTPFSFEGTGAVAWAVSDRVLTFDGRWMS